MLLRTSSAPILGSLNSPCFSQPEAGKDSSDSAQSTTLSSFHSLASPSLQPNRPSKKSSVVDEARSAGALDLDLDRTPRTCLNRVQSEGDLACLSAAMSAVADEMDEGLGFNSPGSHGRKQWTRRVSLHGRNSSFDMKESILEETEREEDSERQPVIFGNSSNFPENRVSVHGRNSSLDMKETILEEVEREEDSEKQPAFFGNSSIFPENQTAFLPDAKPMQGFVLNDGEVYTSFELSSSGSPVACNGKGCRPLTDSECKSLGFLDMASGLGLGLGKGGGFYEWNGQDGGNGLDFSSNTEGYYQSLLQSDPQNPLLLRNYAQFLSEKKGDFKKSEEYYERAILACPNDGDVLSQYAKLQWDVHRDQDRAETYHYQAVQAAPDDCYVMASYASFLWDAEDNVEESPGASATPAVYGAASRVSSPLLASA